MSSQPDVRPYSLGPQIGSGGMGEVFEATGPDGERVALKLMRSRDPGFAARFKREARHLAVVDHPGVVRFVACELDGPTPWIASELLIGEDLSARLARGPLTAAEVVALGLRLCDALDHLHGRRPALLHRDIKPSNVFLCDGDPRRAKLIDFGLALGDDDTRATASAHWVGTKAYASPEQLDACDLDARSDLYSLGAVLTECLCGRRFSRSDAPAWLGARPEQALSKALTRLLEVDRSRRIANARSAARALEEATSRPTRVEGAPRASGQRQVAVACVLRPPPRRLLEHVTTRLDAEVYLYDQRRALVRLRETAWLGDEQQRLRRLERALSSQGCRVGVALGATNDPEVIARAEAHASESVDLAPDEGPFVARAPQVEMLVASIDGAIDARLPHCVSLYGERGVGKTRLCREARARRPQVPFVEVLTDSTRQRTPFGALRDAFAPVCAPELLPLLDQPPSGSHDQAHLVAEARELARAAIEQALRALATDAVVLVIDEIEWLDEPSLTILRSILRESDDLPLAVWAIGDAIDIGARATSIRLERLDEGTSVELAKALGCPDPITVALRSNRRPLFIHAFARAARFGLDSARLPSDIEATHQVEVDALAPRERLALTRAALIGSTFWDGALSAVDGDATLLPQLARAGLLRRQRTSRFAAATQYDFVDSTLAACLVAAAADPDRRAVHAAVAGWIAEQPEARAAELAERYQQAGDAERAAQQFARAAREAMHFGDLKVVLECVGRALDLTSSPETRWTALTAQDDALQLSSERGRRREGLLELRSLAEDDPARAVEAAWRWFYFARVVGGPTESESAQVEARDALTLATRLQLWPWATSLACDLALMAKHAGQLEEALALSEEALDAARGTRGKWFLARASLTAAVVRQARGERAELLALYSAAAAGFRDAHDRSREVIAHGNAGDVLLDLGKFSEAIAAFESQIACARAPGAATLYAAAAHNLGRARRLSGDLLEARRLQTDALRSATAHGDTSVASAAAEELALVERALLPPSPALAPTVRALIDDELLP